MSGTLVFIITISIVVIIGVIDFIYSNKLKKEALAARPADDRIYKVFAVNIDGKSYYVIKKYCFYYPNRYGWNLVLDYSAYKDMTEEKVIELCDKFNQTHLDDLHKNKMNRLLEDIQGNIVH